MSVQTRLLRWLYHLPPAQNRQVLVNKRFEIPLPDGVTLLADRYYPESGSERCPVLLSRTPYWPAAEGMRGRLFAEMGYQVVVVSCRGTFGSGGTWEPFFNEERDGLAVLEWLAQQTWFSGSIGLLGGSYLGLTQWAVAGQAPASVRAMSLQVTASSFGRLWRPGGSFALESALAWTYGLQKQSLRFPRNVAALLRAPRHVARGATALPLVNAPVAAGGHREGFFEDWLAHADSGDEYWSRINFGENLAHVPPAMMVAGWYDIFVQDQVDDFARLRAAGREAGLRVGPWTHGSLGTGRYAVADTLRWMDRHLLGKQTSPEPPRVQLYVMGSGRWAGFDEWPPPASAARWYLHAGGRLAPEPPGSSAPDRYRYDPADPTPGIGGASLLGGNAGPKDNRRLEARADVMVYTSEPLAASMTVIGPITAELHVGSSLDHADIFVRLCDVAPDGRSTNLSDGIVRLEPADIRRRPDGSFPVSIEMFPTANTFVTGHRVRVQVSSGAHPLYARNPGTGEPMTTGPALVAADQAVFHEPGRASALVIPVVEGRGAHTA